MYVYVLACIHEHFLIVPWTLHSSVVLSPSHSSRVPLPTWTLFGPLGPPGPCELPTKSPQCYSNNRPRDKEHIYTSGTFFESKKALFGRFPNLSPPKKTRAPFAPLHPTSQSARSLKKKKVHHSSDGDVGAKYTTPSPIPPANPQAPPI